MPTNVQGFRGNTIIHTAPTVMTRFPECLGMVFKLCDIVQTQLALRRPQRWMADKMVFMLVRMIL
ncbi:hypothetical protein AYO71_10010 [Pseudomonas koreensis]|nr:hypothetical protein AYO71_10010 [Pseudomonas koreensis]